MYSLYLLVFLHTLGWDKLVDLCHLFQVQYSDAQSGKDYVTYLTLSPVQMTFHGTGSTLQASHDQVCRSTDVVNDLKNKTKHGTMVSTNKHI